MAEPKILAKFELDKEGKPQFVEGDRLKHYAIQVFVENAPAEAVQVTYRLDPTYIEPIRKVPSIVEGFTEDVTSYGDYPINATIDLGKSRVSLKRNLSDALTDYYESASSAEHVSDAIQEIKNL